MEEFNLIEDVAAARILFNSGVPLVQLPCWGVVERFSISRPELEKYFTGKNPLAEYVAGYAIQDVEEWAAGLAWAKEIWDVTAAAQRRPAFYERPARTLPGDRGGLGVCIFGRKAYYEICVPY